MKKRHAAYDDEPLVTICELMERLEEGAHGSGVQLTANECFILTRARAMLEAILGPQPKRGAPSRAAEIALACSARRWSGMEMKNAVRDTAKQFRCSHATVYNAVVHSK
jgi:hypothetical protein